VHANDRAGLERLCRYVLRGPVSNVSLSRLPNGLIKLRLTHQWSEATGVRLALRKRKQRLYGTFAVFSFVRMFRETIMKRKAMFAPE